MALLLPAALAYLGPIAMTAQRAKHAASTPKHAQHGSTAAKSAAKSAARQAAMQLSDDKLARVGNPVRDAYHRELMAYMTMKAKAPKGMELSSDGVLCVCTTQIRSKVHAP